MASFLPQFQSIKSSFEHVVLAESEMVRKLKIETEYLVVENYSVRKSGVGVGQIMELGLSEIVLCGQRWGICFYPEGRSDDAHNQGYASLFLILKSAEPVEILLALSIVDQSGYNCGGTSSKCGGISSFYPTPRFVRLMKCSESVGYPEFVKRSRLDGYVKEDSFKICVSIGVFTYIQQQQQQLSSLSCSSLLERQRQWDDEFIFFQLEDEVTFCGPKSIIAARCPLLLPHHPVSHNADVLIPDVVLPDVDCVTFYVVLGFLCNGTLEKLDYSDMDNSDPHDLESFAAKLLGAADRFEIQQLKQICEEQISKKVCRETVFSLLNLAHVCNAAQLESACIAFAAQNNNPSTTRKGVLFNTYDTVISSLLRWGSGEKIKKF